MRAWYMKNGRLVEAMLLANRQLTQATAEWATTRADVVHDRTMTAARDLVEALQAVTLALPVGVRQIDEPLGEALRLLVRGSEILESLPLDLDSAATRVFEAAPLLAAGYEEIARATEAARRTAEG